MAMIVVGGVPSLIPPFKLRELRAAAPYIDRVLGKRQVMASSSIEEIVEGEGPMQSLTSALSDTLSVIAIGVLLGRGETRYPPGRVAEVSDEIEGQLSLSELSSLQPVFNDILREAGLTQARPTEPGVGTMTTSPSASESTESSQSSSQQGALAETGTE